MRLEGVLVVPGGLEPVAAAVICHPHPLYGGDMHNGVVRCIAAALGGAGFAVLRFNFRGVGGSGGRHEGGGGEVEDVRAAVAFLGERTGARERDVALVGYSFGAVVGWRAAAGLSNVGALVAVAPPLSLYPMAEAATLAAPKLAVVATRDPLCPWEDFQRWFAGLGEPKQEATLRGAEHSLAGRETQVGALVAGFLLEQFGAAGQDRAGARRSE